MILASQETNDPVAARPIPRKMSYTMWLLGNNDGTVCLLKSTSRPSVGMQNRLCFPKKYGQSWRADKILCVGPAFENGVWTCQKERDDWKA